MKTFSTLIALLSVSAPAIYAAPQVAAPPKAMFQPIPAALVALKPINILPDVFTSSVKFEDRSQTAKIATSQRVAAPGDGREPTMTQFRPIFMDRGILHAH